MRVGDMIWNQISQLVKINFNARDPRIYENRLTFRVTKQSTGYTRHWIDIRWSDPDLYDMRLLCTRDNELHIETIMELNDLKIEDLDAKIREVCS